MKDLWVEKYRPKKVDRLTIMSPLLLAACGGSNSSNSSNSNSNSNSNRYETSEPVVVILDRFQTNTSHGPQVLKNFYGEFQSDTTEVTVIAEDLDENKDPMPLIRVYEDFAPDVINASWGRDIDTTYPFIDDYKNTPELSSNGNYLEANQFLWENGVTVTASAGNDGIDGATNGTFASSIFPIIVGAYSQYNGEIYDWSDQGSAVVHYYEVGDGWGIEGTSFAAPRVAAHVALIKSNDPDISESSIRTILEKNSLYDFDSGKYVQKLNKIENFDPSITTRVKVEAVFEIFEGRNPSQSELDYWIDQVDNQGIDIGYVAQTYAEDGIQTDDVPPIERIQAFFHYWLERESQDTEVVDMFKDLVDTDNWNQTFDNFIEQEQVDTDYSFVYNNYNALISDVYIG